MNPRQRGLRGLLVGAMACHVRRNKSELMAAQEEARMWARIEGELTDDERVAKARAFALVEKLEEKVRR